MQKKYIIVITIIFSVLTIFTAYTKGRMIVFSSGNKTGNYYAFSRGIVEGLQAVYKKDVKDILSEGSYENLINLASGKAEIALVQRDVLQYAFRQARHGKKSKLLRQLKSLKVIMVAYEEHVHLLVNRNSVTDKNGDGVIAIDDLDGKKINLGSTGSGTYITAKNVLSSYKLSKKTKYLYKSARKGIEDVLAGKCDAGFYVTGVPNTVFSEISLLENVELIHVVMKGKNRGYNHNGVISSYYYDFMRGKNLHNTISIQALVMVRPEFDTQKLPELLNYLYRQTNNFGMIYHEKWYEFSREKTINYFKRNPQYISRSSKKYFAGFSRQNQIKHIFYTGSSMGSYAKIATDLLPVIKTQLGYDLKIAYSSGSAENAKKILSGKAVFAIIQDDVISDFAKTKTFSGKLSGVTIKKVLPLYKEYVHLIINTKTVNDLDGDGNLTINDLKGKKVAVLEKNSGTYYTSKQILASYKFSHQDEPKLYYDKPEVAFVKLSAGKYDAMFKVTALPYDLILNANNSGHLRLISAVLNEGEPALHDYQTDKINVYPGFSGNGITTSCVQAVLATSSLFNDEKIETFIDNIFQKKIYFNNYKRWNNITKKSALDYYINHPHGWSEQTAKYFLFHVR